MRNDDSDSGVEECDFAVAPKPTRSTNTRPSSSSSSSDGGVIGAPHNATTSTPSSSSRGGDGSVASPVLPLLVDLSQDDEDNEIENDEDAPGGGNDEPIEDDASAGALVEHERERGPVEESESRLERVRGDDVDDVDDPAGGNAAPSSPVMLGSTDEGRGPDAGGNADVDVDGDGDVKDVFDVELVGDEEGGGGKRERKRKGRDGEGEEREGEEERQLANMLFFLVSSNTGRVHVYKKQDDKEEDLDEDSFDFDFGDEEDKRPQHCRLVALFFLLLPVVWGQGRITYSPQTMVLAKVFAVDLGA